MSLLQSNPPINNNENNDNDYLDTSWMQQEKRVQDIQNNYSRDDYQEYGSCKQFRCYGRFSAATGPFASSVKHD